ncbi:MAG: glycosyltransferase family 1 protein [Bacteroidota bacterium]
MQSYLHIISFDIPYPANYGGAIDVFHKIRCLNEQGIKIILHCFEYGSRKHALELEKLCDTVYYYKRDISLNNQFSFLPYNVISRMHQNLKENLLKDNYPILFEVLHTCYLLNDPDLKGRKKIFRHSNIEHDYFLELAKGEKSFLKKIYLKVEAFKLKRFEKQITHADYILSVSETDLMYFKKTYPDTPAMYLPSFHPFDELQCKVGQGDYVLYHGNLSISENYNAALWLIKHVFSKINLPVIIAGLNPPQHLSDSVNQYKHITLKPNCSEAEMQSLINDAQIHCLYTEQATGLKLKLLNVLYSGRFVIANSKMLTGTDLIKTCCIADSANEYIDQINILFPKEFSAEEIAKRKSLVVSMNNAEKTKKLIELLT